MKKLMLILTLLVTFTGMADAQIIIKKSDSQKSELMVTLSMSWSWIYRTGDTYYIVMNSSNQFDDAYWMRIGSSKEECLESVSSLLELSKTIGKTDRYEIENGMGEKFYATQYKALGITGMQFNSLSRAGYGYITTPNLKKASKWVESNVK